MKLAYLAHPVSGKDFIEVEANLARAKCWLRWMTLAYQDTAVIAPWIPMCEVMDDSGPAMRKHGLRVDLAIVERCDEIWLCGGRISAGMKLELDHARKHKLIVRDFTDLGLTPKKEQQDDENLSSHDDDLGRVRTAG